MESTGSHWKPVFNILEEALTVYLANPHQVKPRKGHKTNYKDGHWLAHLLRHAMIQPSFIPRRDIRELRDLTRRRKRLMGGRHCRVVAGGGDWPGLPREDRRPHANGIQVILGRCCHLRPWPMSAGAGHRS